MAGDVELVEDPKIQGLVHQPSGDYLQLPTPPRKWQSPQKRQNPESNLQLKNKTWNRTTNIEQSGDVGNKNDDNSKPPNNSPLQALMMMMILTMMMMVTMIRRMTKMTMMVSPGSPHPPG